MSFIDIWLATWAAVSGIAAVVMTGPVTSLSRFVCQPKLATPKPTPDPISVEKRDLLKDIRDGWSAIKGVVEEIRDLLQGIRDGWLAVKGVLEEIRDGLKRIFGDNWDGLAPIPGILKAIRDFLQGIPLFLC